MIRPLRLFTPLSLASFSRFHPKSSSFRSLWLSAAIPPPSGRKMSSIRCMHPFARDVVRAMRNLYPEPLADPTFDNVGLLLESPYPPPGHTPTPNPPLLALVCVDLTTAVADAAISSQAALVIAYHPPIFRGLKQLTLADPQQRSLLRLCQAGVSVYSPHTAIDAHTEGNAAWFCNALTEKIDPEMDHTMTVIRPVSDAQMAAAVRRYGLSDRPGITREFGYGRNCSLEIQVPLTEVLNAITSLLGVETMAVALGRPTSITTKDRRVESFAVCLGSGASTLEGCSAHVLITGEISHHEVLAATERGQHVVLLRHSVGERQFLERVLVPKLKERVIADRVKSMGMEAAGSVERVKIEMCAEDREPLRYTRGGSNKEVEGTEWLQLGDQFKTR